MTSIDNSKRLAFTPEPEFPYCGLQVLVSHVNSCVTTSSACDVGSAIWGCEFGDKVMWIWGCGCIYCICIHFSLCNNFMSRYAWDVGTWYEVHRRSPPLCTVTGHSSGGILRTCCRACRNSPGPTWGQYTNS